MKSKYLWPVLTAVVTLSAILVWGIRTVLLVKSLLSPSYSSDRISDLLINAIQTKRIEANLERLTRNVHRAGTLENEQLAAYIRDSFVNYGLDKVEFEEYDVLLSVPDTKNPDQVSIIDSRGQTVDIVSGGWSRQFGDEARSDQIKFSAYAKAGNVTTTKLIYANYGSQNDFDHLINEANADLKGSILLIRFGKIYRAAAVQLAEKYGAAGVILYSDPADVTFRNATSPDSVYPSTIYMPPDGAQLGKVSPETDGDLLTPLLPSKDYVIRHTVEEMYKKGLLPNMPVTPIGYGDAQKLLVLMDGPRAPDAWQGGLPLIYKIGPTLRAKRAVRLTVSTYPKRQRIRNVIGYIRGREEPDRYIMLGNHYDSWQYGGLDPGSGMASLLEVARAFVEVINATGWRPRRTLVFCAWDAEEYGLIGSAEFVQQHLRRLQAKAVAYLNVDSALRGTETLRACGVPLLHKTLFNAAAKVENPNPNEREKGRKTVYDTWRSYMKDPKSPERPLVDLIGSASDYLHFLNYAGIPSMNFVYSAAQIDAYPLYHTPYDNMHLIRMMDPSFAYHQAVARIWIELGRDLADSEIIPFGVSDYARFLAQYIEDLAGTIRGSTAADFANITYVQRASVEFLAAAGQFEQRLPSILQSSDPVQIRTVNDQLMWLERMFIIPFGLPDRPFIRHSIFAPSRSDPYAGVTVAGIVDTLRDLERVLKTESSGERDRLSIVLNDQISWVAHGLYSAADWLLRDT